MGNGGGGGEGADSEVQQMWFASWLWRLHLGDPPALPDSRWWGEKNNILFFFPPHYVLLLCGCPQWMGILEGEGNSKIASPVLLFVHPRVEALTDAAVSIVWILINCSQNNSNTALTHHPLELSTNHSPPPWLSLAEICFLLKMNFLFCWKLSNHSSI